MTSPRMTPMARRLMILVAVSFFVQAVLQVWLKIPAFEWLALNYRHPGLHTVWQVLSHLFAYPITQGPSTIFSLLLSLLFIWWMIAPFEERYGSARAIQLVLVGGLAAAIPALVLGPLLPQDLQSGLLFGFDPALMTALAAFAVTLRNQMVSLFGVITMTGMRILWLAIGISVASFVLSTDLVALVADLSAVGAGVLLVRYIHRPRGQRRKKPARRTSGMDFRVIQGGAEDPERRRWLN